MAIYRLLLTHTDMGIPPSPGGYTVESGATYAGCSPTNKTACQGKAFLTMADGINFALSRGEIPYQVHSEAESWAIVAGTEPIDESKILTTAGDSMFTTGGLVLIAAGLFFLLPKLNKKG